MLGAVLDCFRPVSGFVVPPRHPELHAAAVQQFSGATCVLQHYTLQFLAEVCARLKSNLLLALCLLLLKVTAWRCQSMHKQCKP